MIKAIAFDLGGVLIDLDMDECIRRFREEMGFGQITELIDPYHQKGIYRQLDNGSVDAGGFRRYILERSRPGCTPDMVDACLHAFVPTMAPSKAEVLTSLHGRYDLLLLSNNNPICMAHIYDVFRSYGIEHGSFFKAEIISYREKVMKPSEGIYRRLVDAAGCRPEEILFLDDSEANVDGAAAVGIKAVLCSPSDDLGELVEAAL